MGDEETPVGDGKCSQICKKCPMLMRIVNIISA